MLFLSAYINSMNMTTSMELCISIAWTMQLSASLKCVPNIGKTLESKQELGRGFSEKTKTKGREFQ